MPLGVFLARKILSGKNKREEEVRINEETLAKDNRLIELMRDYFAAEKQLTLEPGKPVDFQGAMISNKDDLRAFLATLEVPLIKQHVTVKGQTGPKWKRRALLAGGGAAILGLMGFGGYEAIDIAEEATEKTVDDHIKKLKEWTIEMLTLITALDENFIAFSSQLLLSVKNRPLEFGRSLLKGITADFNDMANGKNNSPDEIFNKLKEFIDTDPLLKKAYEDFTDSYQKFKTQVEKTDKKIEDLKDIQTQKEEIKAEILENSKEILQQRIDSLFKPDPDGSKVIESGNN